MSPDIEAYLNDELKGELLNRFEAELARDPALRAEVEFMRPIHRELRLAAITRQVQTAARQRADRRRTWRVLALICSILFGIGLYYYWDWRPHAPGSRETLLPPSDKSATDTISNIAADRQNQAPPLKPIAQGPIKNNGPATPLYRSLPDMESLPADGMALADNFLQDFDAVKWFSQPDLNENWRRKEYEAYFKKLQQYLLQNSKDAAALLAQSGCLLRLHRPQAAETALYRLRVQPGQMGQEARWLLALGYVMQGKDDAARAALEGIASEAGVHQAAARSLQLELTE